MPRSVQAIEAAARAKYALNPTPEVPVSAFNVRGGLTFAGVDGQPSGLYETPKNNFMPRVGLTYKLNDLTVLRGGYGMFYGFLGQRRGDVIQSGFSQNTNIIPSLDNGLTFIGTLSNPFPNGIQEPVGSAQGVRHVPRPGHHLLRSQSEVAADAAVAGRHSARAARPVGGRGQLRGQPRLAAADLAQPQRHAQPVPEHAPRARCRSGSRI